MESRAPLRHRLPLSRLHTRMCCHQEATIDTRLELCCGRARAWPREASPRVVEGYPLGVVLMLTWWVDCVSAAAKTIAYLILRRCTTWT